MPVEVDGFAATERIRAREFENGRRRLRIIALTAGAFGEDRNKCLAAGMNDFLAKPRRTSELDSVLRKWATGNTNAVSKPSP